MFINKSILNLKEEVVRTGEINGLKCVVTKCSDDELFKIESNKRLPKNILDDEIKEERERVIDLCQKYRKIAKLIQATKKEKSDESDNIEEEKSIHQKIYEIATAKYNPFSIGGSENIHDFDSQGGSENLL